MRPLAWGRVKVDFTNAVRFGIDEQHALYTKRFTVLEQLPARRAEAQIQRALPRLYLRHPRATSALDDVVGDELEPNLLAVRRHGPALPDLLSAHTKASVLEHAARLPFGASCPRCAPNSGLSIAKANKSNREPHRGHHEEH